MLEKVMNVSILPLFCFILVTFPSVAFAGNAKEDIKIIKIAAQDQSAVVQLSDGQMKVVHQGDRLKPHGEIISILKERIVFKNKDAETIIINFKNGKQTLRRIGKVDKSTHRPKVGVSTAGHQESGRQLSGAGKASPEKP